MTIITRGQQSIQINQFQEIKEYCYYYCDKYQWDKQFIKIKYRTKIMFTTQKTEKERSMKQSFMNTHTRLSTKDKHPSTGIGLSIKFRQPNNIEQQVKQFTEQLTELKLQKININSFCYQKWSLIKDVNYLNTIYNHILLMISSHLNKLGDSKNYQIVKMSNQIQRIIMENIKLKQQIDKQYQNMNNLQELTDYLKFNIDDAIHSKLEIFLNNFENKQKQAKNLSLELQKMQINSKLKNNQVTSEKIKQKQKKCKAYRKIIEKQKQRIAKYEQQQKSLLNKLYKTQREIIKNQHSTSAIKLKINQVRFSQEKIRSKTKQNKIVEKQNIQLNKQKKNMKIEQSQKLKFLHKN